MVLMPLSASESSGFSFCSPQPGQERPVACKERSKEFRHGAAIIRHSHNVKNVKAFFRKRPGARRHSTEAWSPATVLWSSQQYGYVRVLESKPGVDGLKRNDLTVRRERNLT